ncbi:MAG TPA: glycosyltransferase, partial [Puia sp.]|nr:glycosyltransferase [Puia sp.]
MTFLFTLIACLLFTAYGGLIVAYRRAWTAIPWFEPQQRPATTKITVLVPARNEEAVITACLSSLARQSYSRDRYEVIVLDDHSTDKTAAMVRDFASLPEAGGLALRCLPMSDVLPPAELRAHKKFAIETGVGAATGELIVTTDADCYFHPDWLLTLAACYEERGARFIAAPVRIGAAGKDAEARHRSLLGVFQTLDFITLQGITGAAVHSRFHSMCNGANLAYTREAFYEAGGFKGIDHIPSGDDMFLMHKIRALYP